MIKRWILTALAAAGTSTVAALAYQECCRPLWCSGFEVIGEFLYVRPATCGLSYAIQDDRPYDNATIDELAAILPFGKEHGICPNFEPALRVGGSFLVNNCCNDITVRYTGLWTRDTQTVAPSGDGGIWMTFGFPRYMNGRLNNEQILPVSIQGVPALATERVRIDYNMVDGAIAAQRYCECGLVLRRAVGVRWVDICLRQSADYQGNTTDVVGFFVHEHHVLAKTECWGVGPFGSVDLQYAMWCGFGIGVQLGAAVLIGEQCQFRFQQDDVGLVEGGGPSAEEELNVRYHNSCHVFPELDARIGLNYRYCYGRCFSLLVELGWEYWSYVHALGRIRFNDLAGTKREACQPFTVDGLYVSFRLGF